MPMSVTKIALVGKLRSGKSVLQSYATLYYDFQPFAFGDELKRFYHEIYPYVPREPKPRAGYQRFGQMLRELDKEVWINATLQKVERYVQNNRCADCEKACGARVMIGDVRQQNELDRLKADGYTIIRINAFQDVRVMRAIEAGDDFKPEDLTHETERLVDTFDVDFEIENNGSLTELHEAFDAIMSQLGVGRSI